MTQRLLFAMGHIAVDFLDIGHHVDLCSGYFMQMFKQGKSKMCLIYMPLIFYKLRCVSINRTDVLTV